MPHVNAIKNIQSIFKINKDKEIKPSDAIPIKAKYFSFAVEKIVENNIHLKELFLFNFHNEESSISVCAGTFKHCKNILYKFIEDYDDDYPYLVVDIYHGVKEVPDFV